MMFKAHRTFFSIVVLKHIGKTKNMPEAFSSKHAFLSRKHPIFHSQSPSQRRQKKLCSQNFAQNFFLRMKVFAVSSVFCCFKKSRGKNELLLLF